MTDMNELREKVARAIKPHLNDDFPPVNDWAKDIADAAIATVQEAGWQDIATAPRDGSNILIIAMKAYSPAARQGWWDGTWWTFYSRPEKFVVPGHTHMIEVTHWMPLPPPPFEGAKHD